MKKVAVWLAVAAFAAFVVDWGVIGVKILNGDYDITAGVYLGAVCWAILLACLLFLRFANRCPNCGKVLQTDGRFCPHCGKEVR